MPDGLSKVAIAGVIQDHADRPIRGVVCELYIDMSPFTDRVEIGPFCAMAVTTSDGRFEFASEQIGMRYHFVVETRHRAYAPSRIAFDVRDIRCPLQIQMSEGVELRGTVRAADGTPLEGVEVAARCLDIGRHAPLGSMEAMAITDSRGRYVLAHVNADRRQITASRSGAACVRRVVELTTSHKALDFVLPPGRSISGKVWDADAARPIGDIWVVAVPVDSGEHADAHRPCIAVRSHRDGSYYIHGADRGSYEVSTWTDSHLSLGPRIVGVDNEYALGVDLLCRDRSVIAVRVVDDETGEAVAPLLVGHSVRSDEKCLPPAHRQFDSNVFTFADAGAGRPCWIYVYATGYALARSQVSTVPQNPRESLEVRLVRGIALNGCVVDSKGQPVQAAVIPVESALRSEEDMIRSMAMKSTCPRVRTGLDGCFAVNGLRSGKYIITIWHPNFETLIRELQVSESGNHEVGAWQLTLGASVRGSVRLSDGRPDSRAIVSARPTGDSARSRIEVRSDSRGRYEITGLKAGEYLISILQRERVAIAFGAAKERFDARSTWNQPKVVMLKSGDMVDIDW